VFGYQTRVKVTRVVLSLNGSDMEKPPQLHCMSRVLDTALDRWVCFLQRAAAV
jgi:hypothetical protein